MPIDFYWRLPTHGDKGGYATPSLNRGDFTASRPGSLSPGFNHGAVDDFTFVDHLADIARAAEISGFYGGLIPSFPASDDPWVIAPAIARETKTFRLMIAFQPGFLNPVEAARMSASLQRESSGRLVYNIITGGGGPAQLWWGDRVEHDSRYARTAEFLDVVRGVWSDTPFTHKGKFFSVDQGSLPAPLASQAVPEIYFSGSSDAAIDAAGRHADYYLSWLEPFADLKAKFEQVTARSALYGRTPRFAVRVDVLARETEEEAWAEVRRGWENIDENELREWYGDTRVNDSVGGQHQVAFRPEHPTDYRDLIIAPNLWAGFSQVRPGPAIGIVGDYANAAQRLDDLIELGVDAFILAGTPHLEEAYRVGEEVLPLLRARDRTAALEATA